MTHPNTFALTGNIVLTRDRNAITWTELEESGDYVNGGIAVVDGNVTVLTNAGSHRHLYGDEDYAEDDAVFGSVKELERWTQTPHWRWDVPGEEPLTRYAGSGDPVEV